MKKSLPALITALLILLCSCANTGNIEELNSPSAEKTSAPSAIVTNTEIWTSEGGAFLQTFEDYPDSCVSILPHSGDIYTVTMDFDGGSGFEIWENNTVRIYSSDGASISCADASGEGFWIVETKIENGDMREDLILLSFSGEIIKTIPADGICEGDIIHSVLRASDCLYLKTSDRIISVGDSGELIGSFALPDAMTGLIAGGDGKAYAVFYKEDGIEINRLDKAALTLVFSLRDIDGKIFGGKDDSCFLLLNQEGLFRLQTDGLQSPVIIWRDCGLVVPDFSRIYALPDGEYLCWDAAGIRKLSPTDPSEMKIKTELILATVGNVYGIQAAAARFNQVNDDYMITVRDYTEGGVYDDDTAAMRLNTELFGGAYPDLFLFSGLFPFSYISKGYLSDLYPFIDGDPDIGRGDIAILDKLDTGNGVFFLSSTFAIETRVALYADFGDRTGWTLDEYLEIEKNLPSGAETLYNTTKVQFLCQISARYLRSAVNWEAGTCDFDNEVFISILEASARIKENPENQSSLNFTYGPVRVAEKTLVAAASWVTNVRKLCYEEKMAGCRLSFIGWPTVDGSCGTDLYLTAPVGISSQSRHPEGCWAFLKFMLKDFSPESENSLPAYMPFLQSLMEKAQLEAPSDEVQVTPEDAERFFFLLSEIENIAIYDEFILRIIEESAAMYFAGEKSAKNTAAIIQNRAQLYMSEQYT